MVWQHVAILYVWKGNLMNIKLWIVVVCSVLFASFAHAGVVTLVADEWCPYNCEQESADPGFAVEAALSIFSAAGIEARYIVLDDWDDAIERARAGEFTGIIGAARGDAEDFIFPSEMLAESVSCFFVRAGDTWRYTGDNSLEHRRIGALEAYDYESDAVVENTFGNVIRFGGLEDAVEALLNDEVDTIIEDSYVKQLFELRYYLAGQIDNAGCLDGDAVFIAFSPSHPRAAEFATILSDGIAAMRASGDWADLLVKYGIR